MSRVTSRGMRRRQQIHQSRVKRRNWVKSTTPEQRAVQNAALRMAAGQDLTEEKWADIRAAAHWQASLPGEDFSDRMKRLEES